MCSIMLGLSTRWISLGWTESTKKLFASPHVSGSRAINQAMRAELQCQLLNGGAYRKS